jgi:hypothetical protein
MLGGTIERLELFEFVGVSGIHVFPINVTIPIGFAMDNGKLNFLNDLSQGWHYAIEMSQRELPCEVIEGAPEIVNGVPYNQAPLVRDMFDALNADHDSAPFRLILFSQGEKLVLRTRVLDFSPKFVDVHFCTGDLGPRAC